MASKVIGISLIVLSIISLIISFYVGVYETIVIMGNQIQTNKVNDEFIMFLILAIFLFIIGLVLILINRDKG